MKEGAVSELIDLVADRFESEWKENGPPQIEAYLHDCPVAERAPLILELLKIDSHYRRKAGLPVDVPARLEQFPELKDRPWMIQELLLFEAALTDSPISTQQQVASTNDVGAESSPVSVSPSEAVRPTRIGRFEILDELGRGGFGIVFRAYDSRLNREVAVKVLKGGFLAGRQLRERFLREARSVAQLQHEVIVPIYDFGEDHGSPYLVSKLIRGRSLASELDERRFGFREAAQIVAKVAQALDYAHSKSVIHRDVSPRNILMDEAAAPHVIDFGLAKWSAEDAKWSLDAKPLGTPAYMSPEQAAGHLSRMTNVSDVYSLGAVLYELLTGVQPFEGETLMVLKQIQEDDPRPPRRLNDRIPIDLETICLKAMAKEPARRYASAGEFADDLKRFLNGEPIRARPVSSAERAYRYCRRRWKVVAPTMLAILGLVMTAAVYGFSAQAQARDRERELLLEQIQRLRLRDRSLGWSSVAAENVRKAAMIRADADLRDYAAATLEGLDAKIVKQAPGWSASSVAFDGRGQRLALGAAGDAARLYDFAKEHMTSIGLTGPGPVTFTASGKPLQLAVTRGKQHIELVLYDLERDKPLKSFALPAESERDALTARLHPMPLAIITPDGSRVGVAHRLAANRGLVIVWDATTGRELARWDHVASALTFSPDGSLVAAGGEDGRIAVWSIDSGRPVADLQGVRISVTCLAIHSNPRGALVNGVENRWDRRWILAAGDHGGTVTIWDISDGAPIAFCRGAHHEVSYVAFSPDGALLAGGAHAEVRLWSAATGRPLLTLNAKKPSFVQQVSGMAFSPDGRYLAITSLKEHNPAVFVVFELQHGRGIRTLRGLTGEVAKIRFSPDDSRIAAFSHRWEIGVWNSADGRLLRIVDAPQGYVADNFGLALSHDGSRLAASTGTEARLWDVETGRLIFRWNLPPGLQDELTFTRDGELLLLRFETVSEAEAPGEALPPFADIAPPGEYPRVCRVRRLTVGEPPIGPTLLDVKDFNVHVRQLLLAPDGSYFLGVGIRSANDGTSNQSITRAFRIPSGERLWEKDQDGRGDSRTGPLAAMPGDRGGWQVFKLPEQHLGWVPLGATFVGANRRLTCGGPRQIGNDETSSGLNVYRFGEAEPIVTLGIDRPIAGAWPQLSMDETRIAWGHTNGDVQIADLPTVQRALAPRGLGW